MTTLSSPKIPLTVLKKVLNTQSLAIQHMKGDGSNKSFFRVTTTNPVKASVVLMELETQNRLHSSSQEYDWTNISKTIKKVHVKSPKIIASFPQHNTIIIEDCGNQLLANTINQQIEKKEFSKAKYLLEKTHEIFYKMSKITPSKNCFWSKRSFNNVLFSTELFFFKTHYLDPRETYLKNKPHTEEFQQDTKKLSDFLHDFCNYFTHRDFQCRNILVKKNSLFLIDFQDARLGPIAYDLVSFVFDPYLNLNINQRLELFETTIRNVPTYCQDDIRTEIDKTTKPLILQRLLKAIGSFAFLDKQNKSFPYKNFIKPAIDIIKNMNLHDPRWPYLSNQLIEDIDHYEQHT